MASACHVAAVLEFLDYFKKNDFYTYRHIVLVLALTTLLSKDLISSRQEMMKETAAGPCHDLGARVALNHHERRDGSRYPNGIKTIDRLFEIVAVCDVYDALVSPRPYRSVSYDNRTALEEITLLAEKGKISWEAVKALVSHSRRNKPYYSQVVVSLEKRGTPPSKSVYGVITE